MAPNPDFFFLFSAPLSRASVVGRLDSKAPSPGWGWRGIYSNCSSVLLSFFPPQRPYCFREEHRTDSMEKGRSRFTTLVLWVINTPYTFLSAHVWYNGWYVIRLNVSRSRQIPNYVQLKQWNAWHRVHASQRNMLVINFRTFGGMLLKYRPIPTILCLYIQCAQANSL